MKIEVTFVGASIDMETYEGKFVSWAFGDGQLTIFAGAKLEESHRVASYPESRVVRVRVV